MTVAVDAVIYFRVSNPVSSVVNVEDATRSTKLLAQTTLRNVLGTRSLSEILMERDQISHAIQVGFYLDYRLDGSFFTENEKPFELSFRPRKNIEYRRTFRKMF